MTGPQIFAYVMMGCIVGIVSPLILDIVRCPEGGIPALAFTCGVFWPLSILVGIACAIFLATRALGRSFVALWQAWRPARVMIPRMTAKDRTP